jgi:hypothetical protein
MMSDPYREHFVGWRDPWHFADAETTARRLDAAGLTAVRTWLEEAPVDLDTADEYADFGSCGSIRQHLDPLPPDLRDPFTAVTARAAADPHPFTLDYWRLIVDARKPAA